MTGRGDQQTVAAARRASQRMPRDPLVIQPACPPCPSNCGTAGSTVPSAPPGHRPGAVRSPCWGAVARSATNATRRNSTLTRLRAVSSQTAHHATPHEPARATDPASISHLRRFIKRCNTLTRVRNALYAPYGRGYRARMSTLSQSGSFSCPSCRKDAGRYSGWAAPGCPGREREAPAWLHWFRRRARNR